MTFYYPLGLLGLIGIPIIILIYIIKSKYTEQVVPSTYLWTLSEKFLKKRKPISRVTGILTLILQLLAVLLVAFAVAHPVFTVTGSAKDVFFILDGSASMNMRADDESRFDVAKRRIAGIIDDANSGSTFSLMVVGDTMDMVFDGVSDKAQAKIFLDALDAGWTASDCAYAAATAQEVFDNNRSAEIYLVTDRNFEVNDALKLINVAAGESNFAFKSYACEPDDTGVRAVGQVVSYSVDAGVTVQMWLSETVDGELKLVADTTVAATAGEPCDFELACNSPKYAVLELRIANADALMEDNTVVLYDVGAVQQRKVLIVSSLDEGDDAVYLNAAIKHAGKAQTVDVITPKTYEEVGAQGYDMYVFNGYAPSVLPTQAAVWLVDAIDGGNTETGVGYRGHVTPRDATGPDSYYVPQYNDGTSSAERKLTRDIVGRRVAVRKYAQYTVPREFISVLGHSGDGMVLAGLNANNDRQVVFSFRIKDSNLGLSDDFLILVRNLMDYSFPTELDRVIYTCGETMAVNVVPGCESIVLTSPSGTSNTLDTLDTDVCEVELFEAGTYTLAVKKRGSEVTELYAYAAVPEEESASPADGSKILLSGEREYNYADGYYDELLIFFIVIVLIVLADWGVYCYEQYQLR